MYVVILADEIGSKLWPVTSDELPKAFLPVYSDLTQLEETINRFYPLVDKRGEKFIIVTLEKALEMVISQKTLETFEIPRENVITIPSSKGTAWAMWEAVRYLIDLKEAPLEEPVVFTPSDHFLWPRELAVFHLFNTISRCLLNKDECIALSLTPGGPSPGMDYFFGDWQKVVTIGSPFEDSMFGTVSTLGVSIEDIKSMPDVETAKELTTNNWMWSLNTYFARLETFAHYLGNVLKVKVSQRMRWDFLESTCFSSVIPSIIEDQRMFASLIPKIAWSTLDNWVTIRHLLYDSGIFQPPVQEHFHSVESSGNLIFKPPGKTIALYGISDAIVIDFGDKLLIGTPEALHEYF